MSEQAAAGVEVKIDILGARTFGFYGPLGDNGAPDRMYIGIQRNAVNFSTKIDNNWARIRFDGAEFQMLCQMVRKAAAAQGDFKEAVECWEGKGENRRQAGTLTIGRDADGICYMAFSTAGNQAKRFNFMPQGNYKFLDAQNQPLPRNELSRRKAMAWAAELEHIARTELRLKWDTDKFDPNRQGGFNKGGSGGGFNKGGWNKGGSGGYNGGNRGGNSGGNGGGNYAQPAAPKPAQNQDAMVNFDDYVD